jgi:hypothetical protein
MWKAQHINGRLVQAAARPASAVLAAPGRQMSSLHKIAAVETPRAELYGAT